MLKLSILEKSLTMVRISINEIQGRAKPHGEITATHEIPTFATQLSTSRNACQIESDRLHGILIEDHVGRILTT